MIKNLLSILLIIGGNFVLSQIPEFPTDIKSPTATSLGHYGDIPVNYYNGLIDLKVPIYTLQSRNLPLEIYLNYNSSGVLVNSVPGWVGQNWSLHAGGVITRTTKNRADELSSEPHNGIPGFRGYFYQSTHSLLNTSNWNTTHRIKQLAHEQLAFDGIARDFMPDLFNFNFMGMSGSFFLGEDGQWKISSSSNLKILITESDFKYPFRENQIPFGEYVSNHYVNQTNSYKMIEKITLIDDDGNKFIFGGDNYSTSGVEYSTDFFNQIITTNSRHYWTPSAWNLSKIVDSHENILYEFEYVRGNFVSSFYPYVQSSEFTTNNSNWLGGDCSIINLMSGVHYGGSLISPVYLNKIKSLNKEVRFYSSESEFQSYFSNNIMKNYLNNYDSQNTIVPDFMYLAPYTYDQSDDNFIGKKLLGRKLNTITISGNLGRTFFNYFDDTDKRLTLKNININSNYTGYGYTKDNFYQFEYDRYQELPDFLSTSIDHWGYYNGGNGFNFSGVSSPLSNSPKILNHYNSRQTNGETIKIGMLSKVKYPTKGFSEFVWEANNYSMYISDDKFSLINTTNENAGGIRIKSIKKYNDQHFYEKKYYYTLNYPNTSKSSGILNNKPKYLWESWPTLSINEDNYYLNETIFNTNPYIPLSGMSDSHIGYSSVIELSEDNGYIIYEYTSNKDSEFRDEFMNFSLNPIPSPYTNFSDKSLMRGLLTNMIFKNEQHETLKEKKNYYNSANQSFVKSLKTYSMTCSSTPGSGFLKASPNKIYYFDYYKIKEKEIDVFDSNIIKDMLFEWINYPSAGNFNGNSYLKSKTLSTGVSSNETNKEKIFYNFDIYSEIHNNLLDKNIITPIKSQIFKNENKIAY